MKNTCKRIPEVNYPDRDGFTMIELMIAILVFCVGFVGINKMHAMAIKGNAYNMQLTDATSVMKSTSEWIMGLPLESNSLGGALPISVEKMFLKSPVENKHIVYSPSYAVSQLSGEPLKEITVTVRWSDSGIKHSVFVTFCR